MTNFHDKNQWALILGASSGMGLASAHKLAGMGLNIFAVHRDRKGAMDKINQEFAKIAAHGVKFHALNTNALTTQGRADTIHALQEILAGGKVRTMLHSIALGNLKLAAPQQGGGHQAALLQEMGMATATDPATLQTRIDEMFSDGAPELLHLTTPTAYHSGTLLGEEDMHQTIHNMGTNILFWVQELWAAHLFADDARVLGLTSEGNTIAWRGYGAIAAAKSALESVARTIAVEFAPYGIRCNILQPGITDTPALRLIPGSSKMMAGAKLRNPFGRITTPQDVADVVSLMSSDDARWINGAIIRVDGGEHIAG